MSKKHTPQDFWNRVNVGKPDECWAWNGNSDELGYGLIHYHRRKWRAHRLAYTLTKGEIPKDMIIMHKCDNPACCNPDHLSVGEHKDNVHDMMQKARMKGRRANALEPSLPPKLTEQDVKDIRAEYATGTTSYAQLGKKYNVHRLYVANVVKRKVWKHVA